MLLVGSVALLNHFRSLERKPKDLDFIATYAEYEQFCKQNQTRIANRHLLSSTAIVLKMKTGQIVEFTIAWEGDSSYDLLQKYEGVAPLNVLLMLKLSHRYLRNSPHFHKTMADIHFLREQGVVLTDDEKVWIRKRETETYVYAHPNLNQNKSNFFDASVQYTYEHDDIHEAVAVMERPAYSFFQMDGAEVRSSKKKFMALPEEIKRNSGLEESYVLAIERSLVPFPGVMTREQAFLKALEKVCSSITSGWFREYCWENYHEIKAMYSEDYFDKFNVALQAGKIRFAQTGEMV